MVWIRHLELTGKIIIFLLYSVILTKSLSQVKGEFLAKDKSLARYLQEVHQQSKGFNTFKIEYIPRVENEKSDLLSKLANMKRLGNNRTVIQEILDKPSIDKKEVINREEDPSSWRFPILKYLQTEQLSENSKESSQKISCILHDRKWPIIQRRILSVTP